MWAVFVVHFTRHAWPCASLVRLLTWVQRGCIFEPWRDILSHDTPLPPCEHQNIAVQRLYHQISMAGPAEDPTEPAGEDEEGEEPEN